MKIKTNPDIEFVKEMKTALKNNNGYCPCSPQKTKDTKCMCKSFREQTEAGYCHCGLYFKE
jgi:ferredoxin-thioredoxin reductase catalytic subunit